MDHTTVGGAPYMLLNLGLIFGMMDFYIAFHYIELLALDRAYIPSSLTEYLLVIINLSFLSGRIIAGYYAGRIGRSTCSYLWLSRPKFFSLHSCYRHSRWHRSLLCPLRLLS
jgi:predicted MFS family arabinose efflux permease